MAWSDNDSDNVEAIRRVLNPRVPDDPGPPLGPVGATFFGFLLTLVITVPIGIVMAIAGLPPVYENLVFWPVLIICCWLLWPRK